MNPAALYAKYAATLSRTSPCWCGSGKRFKSCHGALISDAAQADHPTARIDERRDGVVSAQSIVCLPVNKLGNVLRAAASDKILADTIGAKFALAINLTRHPEVHAAISVLLKDYLSFAPLPASKLAERDLMTFSGIYGTNSHPVQEAVFVPADTLPRQDFWVAHIYAAVPHGMTTKEYVRRKISFYVSLPVPPALLASVDAFAVRYELADAVGVHIRHTDNLRDAKKRKFELNTPLPVFFDKMAALVGSGRRILLCSDNGAVIEEALRRMPLGAVVLADAAPHPVLQPLYEMLLLSRCAFIVGSYASTFSYEPCFFRGIDLECFERGEWRLYPIAALAVG